MSLLQIGKYHLNDFQIDWISNKANKVAINANFTRKSFITEYGGRDRALLGRNENLKVSPKFSNQKIINYQMFRRCDYNRQYKANELGKVSRALCRNSQS